MRTVVRNSFARQSIRSERVTVDHATCCTECGQQRYKPHSYLDPHDPRARRPWLYRFHVDDDQGSRHSGPIAGGKLFCSRGCAEAYLGQDFAE